MKDRFEEWNPRDNTLERVDQCEAIIEEYQKQDLKLTLRQLYYQLVSRNLIPNSDKSYNNLGTLVGKARMAGMLDWNAIEDRGRQPDVPLQFQDLEHRIESALYNYRLDRWEGQDTYAELWVEKAALAGVLEPMARRFHVTLMVNKGYSSLSAMYESADRFSENGYNKDRCVVFYLGDHDPSGQDMIRDIGERLNTFTREDPYIEVEAVALTTAQVRQYNPPPNPTKLTDSRATQYIRKHGRECWEVDALDPSTLQRLIADAFTNVIDQDLMDAVIEREEEDKRKLIEAFEASKEL